MKNSHHNQLNLASECLAEICQIAKTLVPEMEVLAYGSRVNGKAHAGSDLDLAIRNPLDLTRPQEKLSQLRAAFAESNIPIQIQILDWASIPSYFQEEIQNNYVLLQRFPLSSAK
jgi:predicted nucleotidyltransferase